MLKLTGKCVKKGLFPYSSELGHFMHPCEGDLVCKCTNEKIPYFNAPVYLENKSQIGKVDDIFGPMTEFVSFCQEKYLSQILQALNMPEIG